jgi:hypothetical protein
MSSIVLDPGVKEMLLDDTRDFLRSEKWYADRGIPFRRGYLLHGVSAKLSAPCISSRSSRATSLVVSVPMLTLCCVPRFPAQASRP